MKLLAVVAAAAAACVLAPAARAQDGVTLAAVEGNVTWRASSAGDWAPAASGAAMQAGAEVKTGAASGCDIRFGSGAVIGVRAGSIALVESVRPPVVRVREGRVFSLIEKLEPGSEFKVTSAVATAAARGTGWSQTADGLFGVFDGTIRIITATAEETDGNEGESWRVGPGGALEGPYPLSDEEREEWLRWVESHTPTGADGGDPDGDDDFLNLKDEGREADDKDRIDDMLNRGDEGGSRGGGQSIVGGGGG